MARSRRLITALPIILAAVCLLCACAAEQPAAAIPVTAERALYAGGSFDGDALIHSLVISTVGDGDYRVEIAFTKADSSPLGRVPKYSAAYVENPSRIILRGNFFGYNCARVVTSGNIGGFVIGRDRYYDLYLQFDGHVVTTAVETGNTLTLNVSRLSGQSSALYYMMAHEDAMPDALSPEDISMSPILSDGRVFYIADIGFDEKAQADQYALGFAERHGLPLSGTAVAAFSQGIIDAAFVDAGVVDAMERDVYLSTPEGDRIAALYWAYDARFLTWLDGRRALFARDSGRSLWSYALDGAKAELGAAIAHNIDKAEPSPDGRFLALIISDGQERRLMLYDTGQRELYDLTDYGMGVFTPDFCWGEDARLYAISGDLEYSRLLAFDPAEMESGEQAVYPLGSQDILSPQIASGGGRLFFTDGRDVIWTSSLNAEAPMELTGGDTFLLSPSGDTLCVVYYEGEPYTDDTGIKLYSVKDGREITVSTGSPVMRVCYSLAGDKLHYILKDESQDGDKERPALLYSYIIDEDRSVFHGSLETDVIFALPEGNIGLTLYSLNGGVSVPVTYRLKLTY